MEYTFTLRFQLPAADEEPDKHVGRLLEEGCDDALVGIGKKGRIALSFLREAESANAAVLSAVSAVRRAIPGVMLTEATPDFVGLTDAAELLGFSRQNMRQLIFSCEATTPAPVHEGKPTIWHLADLLRWLREQKGYAVPEALLDLAETNMQVNIAVNAHQAKPSLQRKIRAVLASRADGRELHWGPPVGKEVW
jgi:hypothetical protein